MAEHVDPRWWGRIVHASLRFGSQEVFGVDSLPDDYVAPQGMYVTINIDDAQEARRLFAALADDGVVRVPYQKTFWSPGFGVVTDRFGIPWEINCS